MSQTLSPSSLPVDASLPGGGRVRSLRQVDMIRGAGRLLWIEFRRCGGYWMLPLILPLVWFMNQGREDNGVVFWLQMSIVAFQSYVIIAPLTAGLAAWLAGRERRRRTEGLVETAPFGPFRRDLLLLGAAAGWGIVAYALVGAWYLGQAALFATWGGPDLGWLTLGVLAIVLHAALGYLIGRAIPGRFAALVAVALPIGFAIGADAYHRTTEVDLGGEIGRVMNYEQPLLELSPFSSSMWLVFDDGTVETDNAYVHDTGLWVLGLLGVMLATIALVRHRRSLVGIAGLSLSLVAATLGANSLLGDGDPDEYVESRVEPFEWSCGSELGIEVCLHPAYEVQLDDATVSMVRVVTPFVGLPGFPIRWEQSIGWGSETDRNDDIGTFNWDRWANDHSLFSSIASELFGNGHEGLEASQLVVITAFAEQVGISVPGEWIFGWPSEVTNVEGEGFYEPDEAALTAFRPGFDAAVDRFTALSLEEQRAWLEANWDVLRVGELTLEDMP